MTHTREKFNENVIIVFCALYVYEDLGSKKPYIEKKYFMADNCNKKIRETLYTLLFVYFLIHIARGKLMKFLPAIVPIPERTR